jgi:hypothetical protein
MKKLFLCIVAGVMLLLPAGGRSSFAAGLAEPVAELPAFITSLGQSADYEVLKVIFDKNKMSYHAKSIATKEDFGDSKTLVVAIGGSSKGLGAAGIDPDEELARGKKLLQDAKEAGLTIIAAHIGGAGRRGKLGDRYIAPAVSQANYVVVVEAGNKDGLFTQLAEEAKIPIDVVPSIGSVPAVIEAAFKR